MHSEAAQVLGVFGIGVVLVVVTGLYSLVTTQSLIRALIGLEILTKAVTLLIIMAGHITGRIALAQALAITLIVVEVAVIPVGVGIVVRLYSHTRSVEAAQLQNLKG